MPRKTIDPVEVKLLDAMNKARTAWERGWRRMKRAVHAMEKADRTARRLALAQNNGQEERVIRQMADAAPSDSAELAAGRAPREREGGDVNPTYRSAPTMLCRAPAKSFLDAPRPWNTPGRPPGRFTLGSPYGASTQAACGLCRHSRPSGESLEL